MGEVYLKYQNQEYNLHSDIRSGDIEHIFGNNLRGYKINNSLSSLVTNLKYFIGKGYKIKVRADMDILKATTYEIDKISLNSVNAHIELSKTYKFGLETKLSYKYISQLPDIYNFINFTYSRSPFEIINSDIYNLNTENHLTSLSLSYNDVFNSRNVYLTTLYSFGKKFWLNKLNFFKTIIEKEPFYSVGNNFLRVHGSFDQFFPELKSGIKIKPRFYYAKNVNNINNFETSVIYQIREVDVDIYTSLFSPVKFNLDFMYSQNVSYAKNNYADRNKTDIFNANTSFLLAPNSQV